MIALAPPERPEELRPEELRPEELRPDCDRPPCERLELPCEFVCRPPSRLLLSPASANSC